MAYETFLELITIVFRWPLACQATIEQAQSEQASQYSRFDYSYCPQVRQAGMNHMKIFTPPNTMQEFAKLNNLRVRFETKCR